MCCYCIHNKYLCSMKLMMSMNANVTQYDNNAIENAIREKERRAVTESQTIYM